MLLSIALAHAAPAYDLLRGRDGVSCAQLGDPTPALRGELIGLTDPAFQPSWVPVRAAGCLVELYAADPIVQAAVRPWMTDPSRAGLALVVVGKIDAFPVEVATELARAAVTAPEPWKERFEARLATSVRPEVRAVLDGGKGGQ